jgi:hypothetical protein
MIGSTISHSSSVSGAPSGAIAVVFDPPPKSLPDGLSRLRARLAPRLAFLQQAATAWYVRLHSARASPGLPGLTLPEANDGETNRRRAPQDGRTPELRFRALLTEGGINQTSWRNAAAIIR